MMKAVNSKEFDMVASWSVDRLGRSLTDLLSISRASTKRVSVCFFISKGSIQRLLQGKRCFKCSAYLPSSSGASFANG